MTTEIHALSGAYAVDGLDDIERAKFERYLAECAECRAEVASLRSTAARLAEITATAPPEGLRSRVLTGITTVRPLPPAVTTGAAPRRRFRLAPLAAAAALIAAVGTGVVWQPWNAGEQQTVSPTQRVRQAEDARDMTQHLDSGGTATLVRSPSQHAAILTAHDMATLPRDRVYQLWLLNSVGKVRPAGFMNADVDRPILLEGDAATARAAAITIEPAGGSQLPTTAPIALFEFKRV